MTDQQGPAAEPTLWEKIKGWFSTAKESEAAEKMGDMAEKAVVMAAIIIGAYATWRLLGNRISRLASQVAGAI